MPSRPPPIASINATLSQTPTRNRSASPRLYSNSPGDLAKDQFGRKGVDFIAVMSILLLRTAKDQSSGYPIDPVRVAKF